jgi:hypothetical protein
MAQPNPPSSTQVERRWITASQHRLMSACADDSLVREAERIIADTYAAAAERWEWREWFRRQIVD